MTLRRIAATLAAQYSATIREVQQMLGHTTVAMVYQVASDMRDRDRAGRFDAAIRWIDKGPRASDWRS